MNILWQLETAFVKEIIEKWPESEKPAYNTVSTTVRILEDKDFVSHKAFGRTHQYFPVVTKSAYQRMHIKNVLENVFAGSASSLVSALVDNKGLSENELKDLKDMIDKEE